MPWTLKETDMYLVYVYDGPKLVETIECSSLKQARIYASQANDKGYIAEIA
jgi:hypothetical protein